ncbi:unnamed protein product [Oikopleura dioica]|uniref:Sulfide:quinone oxidoreductase, mitochondrial n=1 Tax=Oikopleura dioica TaxID=34765 RepID=E4XM07_OIKDI|nr:unnamed protein product [Oikopleura dioica]
MIFTSPREKGDRGDLHPCYQPLWTLVGGGQFNLADSGKPISCLMPKSATHVKENVSSFQPAENKITLESGSTLNYDALVVAAGLELNYAGIDGAREALKEDAKVCSNYSPAYVLKTFPAIKSFKGGKAVFTFPPMPIKCPGAPQKIMWIANDIWKKDSSVGEYQLEFNTFLPVIFGVPKYAEGLMKLVESENVNLNRQHTLVEVDHLSSLAKFKKEDGEIYQTNYDFLHITPNQRPLGIFREDESQLTDAAGWVSVNEKSLQHSVYENVFGVGDCTSIQTSKTAAAITSQHAILCDNLNKFFNKEKLAEDYDGYTSCPLVTSQNTCIMAEFGFGGEVMESTFLNQGKNRYSMYLTKRAAIPFIYWQLMMRGLWAGPKPLKPLTNPFNWN